MSDIHNAHYCSVDYLQPSFPPHSGIACMRVFMQRLSSPLVCISELTRMLSSPMLLDNPTKLCLETDICKAGPILFYFYPFLTEGEKETKERV